MLDHGQFLNKLNAVCSHLGQITAEGTGSASTVTLDTNDGRTFAFEGHLGDIYHAVDKTDASGLWPGEDATSIEVKLRLFSVHLYEAIETAPKGARTLELHSYGVVAA